MASKNQSVISVIQSIFRMKYDLKKYIKDEYSELISFFKKINEKYASTIISVKNLQLNENVLALDDLSTKIKSFFCVHVEILEFTFLKIPISKFLETIRTMRDIESKLMYHFNKCKEKSVHDVLKYSMKMNDMYIKRYTKENQWKTLLSEDFYISNSCVYEFNEENELCMIGEIHETVFEKDRKFILENVLPQSIKLKEFTVCLSFCDDENNELNASLIPVTEDKTFLNFVTTEVKKTQRLLRVYLNYGKNKVIVLNGFFPNDNFQMFSSLNIPELSNRVRSLNDVLRTNNVVSKSFSERWLKTLTLMDYCINDNVYALYDDCVKKWNYLSSIEMQLISKIVKDFFTMNLHAQQELLTVLFLSDEESDMLYLGFMIIDMIKSNMNALLEKIISNLSWFIKKRIIECIDSKDITYMRLINSIMTNKEQRKLDDSAQKDNFLGEEMEMSYESRIILMKTTSAVKKKALEKLKEIQGKSGSDSQSKAQQYLDGLLKIPFGIYKKEPVFSFFNTYKRKIHDCLKQYNSLSLCQNNLESNSFTVFVKEFLDAHPNYEKITNKNIENIFEFYQKEVDFESLEEPDTTKNVQNQFLIQYLQTRNYDQLLELITKIKNLSGKKVLKYTEVNKETKQKKKVTLSTKFKSSEGFKKLDTSTLIANISIYLRENEDVFMKIIRLETSLLKSTKKVIDKPSSILFNSLNECKRQWQIFGAERKKYIKDVEEVLDTSIYTQKQAKRTIQQLIAQWITGNQKGDCFGFEGPPGTGKTSIAKRGLSKCLKDENGNNRPFAFIALGGSTNGSFLDGHSYTYVGSLWGKIVDILMETKCMNPIIFIDELDKVSNTETGREIIGILTHITDSTQNDEFVDKYFSGVKIDLSKVLFIFSYNDPTKIDPILKDRIHSVKFEPLTKTEKKHVARYHLLPEIFENVGISEKDIVFSDDVLEFIISNYTFEGGARKLKEHLMYTVRELNLRYLNSSIDFPINVTESLLKDDLFKTKMIKITTQIRSTPRIGIINGMYASYAGIGGITIIECFRIPSTTPLTLELTGSQGKVMKESMSVAKTVVWNLLSDNSIKNLQEQWKENGSWGLHLHTPEGATPKDGPSAGTAITLCILSCVLQLPINNTIAITGEIDLGGNVGQIGGLEAKVRGAKDAGVKHVFFPKENEQDLNLILETQECPFQNEVDDDSLLTTKRLRSESLTEENFRYTMISNIKEILPYVFDYEKLKTYLRE